MTEISTLPEPRAEWSYFLDVDGTLAEIAWTPDHVEIADTVVQTLAALVGAVDGAVALISGRSLADLDRLFAPLRLAAAGQHGMEMRGPDGSLSSPRARPQGYGVIRSRLREFASHSPGVLLEEKGYTLALHYRRAPKLACAARAAAAEAVTPFCDRYHVLHGNMVLEIKPDGTDKGTAIREFMTQAPYKGRRPVFAGDDTTDEDGFAAVNEVDGLSIRVGENGTTRARVRIGGVDELVNWLARVPGVAADRRERRADADDDRS